MKRKNEDKMKKMTISGYFKKHLKKIPLTVLFFIAIKPFSYLLVPYSLVYLKKMIDSVSTQSFVTADFLIFVLINFLIWGTSHLSSFLDNRLELSVGKFIAYDMVEKLHRVSYSVFEDTEAKDIIQRVNDKPEDAVLGYFHNCLDIVLIFVQLCGFMIIIAKASYWLTVFLILMLLFTCVFDAKSMSLMNRMFQHQSRKEREVAELEYHLKNKDSLFVLRIYDGLQRYIHKYFKRVEAMEQERKKTTIQANRYVILIYVMIGSWMLISIVFSVGLLTTHKISVGLFSVLITSFIALLSVSEQFSYSISTIFENRFRVQKLLEFMNFSERTVETERSSKKEEIAISFENVVFHYPNDKKNILQGLSFQIKNGEHVSIIGNNGSGKTTLLKLLLGLYPPVSGEIRMFGRNISSYSDKERAKVLSVVFQDYSKFQLTVRENVALANLSALHEDRAIDRALEQAGLNFLRQENWDRTLGKLEDDGLELSGGQWQRMAIARALFHGKKLLFFDEPLAASDPIQEAMMYEKLFQLSQGRTSVTISHRMGSVKKSDRILVLDQGRIAEDGNHMELMNKQGIYYNFYKAQSSWYKNVSRETSYPDFPEVRNKQNSWHKGGANIETTSDD